jgi:hypothetical protein
VEEFNEAIGQRTVHNSYIMEKNILTVDAIALKLKEVINFIGRNTTRRVPLK